MSVKKKSIKTTKNVPTCIIILISTASNGTKFDAGAPRPGMQTTQPAFDNIIRDVTAQVQNDPELQEAARMNALLDENDPAVFNEPSR